MQYQELHLINQMFIVPPHDRRPVRFCPREEIADPLKLMALVEQSYASWAPLDVQGAFVLRTWIPWKKCWKFRDMSYTSSGVYALTDYPSMFYTMKTLLENPTFDQVTHWLEEWYDKLFLVTGPLLHLRKDSEITSHPYALNNTFPVHHIPLNMLPMDYALQLIMAQSYTICNGLTLLLAMYRMGKISYHATYNAIVALKAEFIEDAWFQNQVPDEWSALYYTHPTPHVADHPLYYVLSGNHPSRDTFQALLKPMEDDDMAFQPITNIGNTCVFTSSASPTLQSFHESLWNEHLLHTWPAPPIEMDTEDELLPDVGSLFIGVIKTKASWSWWLQNHTLLLPRIASSYPSKANAIEDMLSACFYLYQGAKEHTQRLCYSRIRQLWQHVLCVLDPKILQVNSYIHRNILKLFLVEYLSRHDHTTIVNMTPEIPYPFLKTLVEQHGENLDFYTPRRVKIYSKHIAIIKNLLQGKKGVLEDIEGVTEMVHYSSSILNLFENMNRESPYGKFYEKVLQKRIASRILAIQYGVGMKENQIPTLSHARKVQHCHIAGMVFLDYLRDHKHLLLA